MRPLFNILIRLGILKDDLDYHLIRAAMVIIFLFQWQYGYFWTNRGYEYALLWLLLCTAIFFRGGGRYSVDHMIGKEI